MELFCKHPFDRSLKQDLDTLHIVSGILSHDHLGTGLAPKDGDHLVTGLAPKDGDHLGPGLAPKMPGRTPDRIIN
eukprot:gene29242-12488_t